MSWYFENGPEADVVVSSRVRFARNIHGNKFTGVATEEEQKDILKIFKTNKVVSGLKFIQINDLDELMRKDFLDELVDSYNQLTVNGTERVTTCSIQSTTNCFNSSNSSR